MNIVTRFFTKLFTGGALTIEEIERDLIRRESEIGRKLFGEIPAGVKRDFFCLDERTWVWHEKTQHQLKVTRYVINPSEIIKSVNGGQYVSVSLDEADNLVRAIGLYKERVSEFLYGISASTAL